MGKANGKGAFSGPLTRRLDPLTQPHMLLKDFSATVSQVGLLTKGLK